MTDNVRQIAMAKGLTKGAARAMLRMSAEWQFPGKQTFAANGAFALYWARTGLGRGALVEMGLMPHGKHKRYAYRLTPLGLLVKAELEKMEEGE